MRLGRPLSKTGMIPNASGLLAEWCIGMYSHLLLKLWKPILLFWIDIKNDISEDIKTDMKMDIPSDIHHASN